MLRRLYKFWRGLSANWVGAAGVVLTTSSFVLFILAEALRILGLITNAYIGLITYLALPALFVLGLLLIPIGWWIFRRRTRKTTRELLSERFEADFLEARPRGSKLFNTIAILTVLNVIFLAAGSTRMLRFMDQPEFCGTACHSVMSPEWTTYQQSSHARVRCVDCHVGEGLEAEFDAKLNGAWQMISVTFDLYERPIPTPVHNLRPARETCEKCHWPDAFYGNRIKRVVHFADDRDSTPRYTTLSLKIGSGRGVKRGEIHWHVAGHNQVRYLQADDKRLAMHWVEVRKPDGGYRRFNNRKLADPGSWEDEQQLRILDCVDCHNRATHIFEDPEEAVDRRIASGLIDRSLPYIKRQSLEALTGSYPKGKARESIDLDLRGYYRLYHPEQIAQNGPAIDSAVEALRQAHARNIHERMQVTWNVYPDHLGHRRGPGCRRCHSPDLLDERGEAIPSDCTLCHSILAYESEEPFQFLMQVDPSDPECQMHLSLQREFLGQNTELKEKPCDRGALEIP
jgi:nitrate/TMAO reductase-like tetraheme cytochrome c subunit